MAYKSGSLFMQTTKMYGILTYNHRMYFAKEPEDQYPEKWQTIYLTGYIPAVTSAWTASYLNFFPRYAATFVPPVDCTLLRVGWAFYLKDPDADARYVHLGLIKGADFADGANSSDASNWKTVAIIQSTAIDNDNYDENPMFCYGVEDFSPFSDSTCDTTTDSAIIACDSSSRIRSGMVVNGTGIPTNSTVTKISTSPTMPDDFAGSQYDLSAHGAVTYFTISNNATADGTDVTLTFSWGLNGGSEYCNIDANQATGWVMQSKADHVSSRENNYLSYGIVTAVYKSR